MFFKGKINRNPTKVDMAGRVYTLSARRTL